MPLSFFQRARVCVCDKQPWFLLRAGFWFLSLLGENFSSPFLALRLNVKSVLWRTVTILALPYLNYSLSRCYSCFFFVFFCILRNPQPKPIKVTDIGFPILQTSRDFPKKTRTVAQRINLNQDDAVSHWPHRKTHRHQQVMAICSHPIDFFSFNLIRLRSHTNQQTNIQR